MGKGPSAFQASLVIIGLLLVGISGYGIFKITQDEGTPASMVPASLTQSGQIVQGTAVVSCPSDGTTDGQVRYMETLAATITYDDPVVYFSPKTAGMERVAAGTLQTDGTYSTAVNLKCTESGTRWQPIAVTKVDECHSAIGNEFIAEGSYAKVDLKGKASDTLKFKVEDKYTGGAKFFNVTALTTVGEGSYIAFNGSKAVVKNGVSTGTSLTLGTDGYLDARIYLKTNNTKKQFGEDGLRTFLLVDADGSEWDEPIVARDGGAKLVNVVDAMSTDDNRKYSGYEYAYEIGSVGDREAYVDFYLEAADGVNPSSNPIVEFCAEGRYNSQKEQDTIKVGCWTDAATQTAVFTNNRPYFEFDVA